VVNKEVFMTLPVRRITNIVVAFVMAVFSINIIGAMNVYAASNNANPNAGGNNGTLKVHEQGTASGTESNDPKVCAFNFEGFDFDANQDGYVVIDTQPGDVVTATVPFGPADATGYAETSYINDGISGITVPDGQYKATLYGKDTGNPANPDLTNEKAKSKVFKVDCPESVTPATPTSADVCGMIGDTYTIPTTAGVKYQINGSTVAAGTYPGFGAVTINAVADDGFVLTGTTVWNFTFNMMPCVTNVTPIAPSKVDICGTANDTYTIPSTPGVIYFVNGVPTSAGTYTATGTVNITATPLIFYALTGTTSWTFNFTNTPCVVTPAAPTKNDVCGKQNDTYTIPSTVGVRYFVNGVEKAAGTYSAPTIALIVAVAKPGYALNIHSQLIWLYGFTNKKCPQPCQPFTGVQSLTFIHHDDDDEDCIPLPATPGVPSKSDVCGTGNDMYTIPSTTGIKYLVNGVEKAAGTYPATGPVTIQAVALQNYVLMGDVVTQWGFEFTNAACPTPELSAVAECSQTGVLVTITNDGDGDGIAYINGDDIEVPANDSVEVTVPYTLFKADVTVYDESEDLLLDKAFDCTPGRGNAGGPEETPVVPAVVMTAAVKAAPTTELPTTGGISAISQLIATLTLAAVTYGATYYLWNRRNITNGR
jgi:hypothetical protein